MKTLGNALISFVLAWTVAGMVATSAVAQQSAERKAAWERIWDNPKVDTRIRGLIRTVDGKRMSKHLFYLSKDPLPYRKLNFTLPGHQKNTLYEADDYLAGQLES